MHGPQAAALKVGVDDVLLLRLGVGDTGLKDATAATIFAFELGVAAGVVAIFDDVGGLAAGAVVGDGGLDHGGHQRDQGQSILMYHVGLRYYPPDYSQVNWAGDLPDMSALKRKWLVAFKRAYVRLYQRDPVGFQPVPRQLQVAEIIPKSG